MNIPVDHDAQKLNEYVTIVRLLAPALDAQSLVQEFVRRRATHGPTRLCADPSAGAIDQAATEMLCPPAPMITPLRLRTFPYRMQDNFTDDD